MHVACSHLSAALSTTHKRLSVPTKCRSKCLPHSEASGLHKPSAATQCAANSGTTDRSGLPCCFLCCTHLACSLFLSTPDHSQEHLKSLQLHMQIRYLPHRGIGPVALNSSSTYCCCPSAQQTKSGLICCWGDCSHANVAIPRYQ